MHILISMATVSDNWDLYKYHLKIMIYVEHLVKHVHQNVMGHSAKGLIGTRVNGVDNLQFIHNIDTMACCGIMKVDILNENHNASWIFWL